MVHLTRLNRTKFVLNSNLIEHIQATPDTVIVLTTGNNFRVLETPEEVIERIVAYQRRINLGGITTLESIHGQN